MKKIFTLFTAALVAASLFAGELTIADGTDSNEKLPVYSYNGDVAPYHVQLIYPAQYLQDLNGASIQSLTFHVAEKADKELTAVYSVGVTIVSADYFDGGVWGSSFSFLEVATTKVYEGTMDASQETVTVTFDEPFAFAGGNLLLDIQTKTKGTYADAKFAGINTEKVQGIYGNTIPVGGQAFLPKTTIVYEGDILAPCVKPTALTLDDKGSDFAQISWTAGNEESQWQVVLLKAEDELDWTGAKLVNEASATFEHLQPSTDYVAYVRAYCDASRQSFEASLEIHTDCGIVNALPWYEPFAVAHDEWPECWERISETASPAGSFSQSLMFTFSEQGSQIAVSPEFGIRLDTLGITFRYSTNEYSALLEIGYLNENNEFVATDLGFGSTRDWVYVENAKLENFPEDVRRLAFRYTYNDTDAGYVYLDNITIDVVPEEEETGLEGTQSTEHRTQKVFVNGKLIIEHNGERYNAQGVRL